MKKKIVFIICALLVLGIINCIIYEFDKKQKNTDAYRFKVEYESLNGEKSDSGKTYRTLNISKKNRIKYSTAEEIVKKIDNNESFIVYFGFAKCPWCRSMIENLLDLADEKETDIYYVDVLDIRDVKEVVDGKVKTTKKGTKAYIKLLTQLDTVLSNYSLEDESGKKYDTNEKRIYAPNVVAIVNGKPEKLQEGISSDLKDPYGKITNKMKQDSIDQLKCIFKCMEKAGICTKESAC
ncbi:MAG: hypothetical protein J6O56_03165 [Bacilli bacterium]|nr:hypothetical protein [Bacilli bacterium]